MLKRGAVANLALNFRRDVKRNTTLLDVVTQEPPLRVVRAFENGDGAALAHLHNLSGGVLGGDQLGLAITVGTDANAQVTSTGSTRVYRQRSGEVDSLQKTEICVGTNGLLEYLPDTLIPFAESRYRQSTRIALSEGAGLFYWELVTPGREGLGELFDYEFLRLELDICVNGLPIAIERMQLEPAIRPLSSLMRLGHFRYFATFYICRVGLPAEQWLQLEGSIEESARQQSTFGEVLWGVSNLCAHGLVIRGMAMSSRSLYAGLLNFWRMGKEQLYQSKPILPRKIY